MLREIWPVNFGYNSNCHSSFCLDFTEAELSPDPIYSKEDCVTRSNVGWSPQNVSSFSNDLCPK